jgi:6-phosphogluconate dehydrogenase
MSPYEIGMVGLGVMGRNLLLNMADHGYTVAGYDKDPARGAELRRETGGRAIHSATSLEEFIGMLRIPRVVMLPVPTGPAVDSVIRDLLPHLAPGDVIVDGGNSFFRDTELRQQMLADHGIYLLGVGVSGGEAYVIEIPVPGRKPEEIVIDVTSDTLTVSTRPGQAESESDGSQG